MNDMTSLPEHGRPRTDNLPDDVAALPVLPLDPTDEQLATAHTAAEKAKADCGMTRALLMTFFLSPERRIGCP